MQLLSGRLRESTATELKPNLQPHHNCNKEADPIPAFEGSWAPNFHSKLPKIAYLIKLRGSAP